MDRGVFKAPFYSYVLPLQTFPFETLVGVVIYVYATVFSIHAITWLVEVLSRTSYKRKVGSVVSTSCRRDYTRLDISNLKLPFYVGLMNNVVEFVYLKANIIHYRLYSCYI